MPVCRIKHKVCTRYFLRKGCKVSSHDTRVCLIDFGQELRYISRTDAAKAIRKARNGGWVERYDFPTWV